MRSSLQRRRGRERAKLPRGSFCEARMYSGRYYGSICFHYATGYQTQNDIYVCGIHARAYIDVQPFARLEGTNS